jgi:hypothetical protein
MAGNITTVDTVHSGISKVERYGWKVVDDEGKPQKISKTLLLVDSEYQRQTTEAKVARIAKEWSWIACGVLIVADRDGKYYVVDGWHRKSAADRRSDIDELNCLVFKTEDVADEALAFYRIQKNRKAMSAVDSFRAQLAYGDKTAMKIERLAARAGREIKDSESGKAIKGVSAIASCLKTDADALERLWPLMTELFAGQKWQVHIMLALHYIERNLDDATLTKSKWKNRILGIGTKGLSEAIRAAMVFYKKGGAKVGAEGVRQALNKGLHQKNKLMLSFDE